MLKTNSKSKILKFWTLFIKNEDNDDDEASQDKEPADNNATRPAEQFVRADCCNPIPGDQVVGFRDPATGKIIDHKANCEELNRLASQFGKNIIKEEIHWSQHKSMSYLSTVELRGIDRMGILLDLTKVISGDFSINIRAVSIQSHDGIFEGTLSIYVKDAESLNAILDKIRKVKGIETVKRILN